MTGLTNLPEATSSEMEFPDARSKAIAPGTRVASVEEFGWLPVGTLVLWLLCLAVGVIGIVCAYPGPRLSVKPPEPLQAVMLDVELTTAPVALPAMASLTSQAIPPPPLPDLAVPVPVPALLELQTPRPDISLPPTAPSPTTPQAATSGGEVFQTREPRPASVSPMAASATAVPVGGVGGVEALTFGLGEGKQPSPSYPPRARREGQEGRVVVRFSVGEAGHVIAAEAVTPSPWPLLNAEAVNVIRQRWRFRPGPVRLYEVAILFELRK